MKKDIYWIIFYNDNLLIRFKDGKYSIPCGEISPIKEKDRYVHTVSETENKIFNTFSIDEEDTKTLDSSYMMIGLRESYDMISLEEYKLAGKAYQYLYWDKYSNYCSCCGTKTVRVSSICKKCPNCHHEFFPNISPAIIVRIHKNDSILLVRAKNFRGKFNGLVAGFLEGGETLEECVQREVMEETGITIKDIKYFGSQPWPYPSGIMIGFTANYVSGDIKLQEEELTAGSFFTKENLPEIPRKLSIARKMIDAWLDEK